jgi:plastocyanin
VQIFFGGTDMMKTIRLLSLLVTIAGLIEFGGCNSSSNPYSSSSGNNAGNNTITTPNTVVLYNMSFGPSTLTVAKGTTVTWQNNDGIAHTATSDTGAWDSGTIPAGGSKGVTFNTAGTFPYHCTVHPMMTATIIVQ